jgi:dCTP deaminase
MSYPKISTVIDFNGREHEKNDYFEEIKRPKNGELILKRDGFYILNTRELISIPTSTACEMIAYDTEKGEFRSHYAGFFDPGFGYGENGEIKGQTAVLEVITMDNDFYLKHGQPICKMVYKRLKEKPEIYYGEKIGSTYHNQVGPRLSKHFKID